MTNLVKVKVGRHGSGLMQGEGTPIERYREKQHDLIKNKNRSGTTPSRKN